LIKESAMPAMPWSSGSYTDDTELLVLTSRLPLTRWRDVPRFMMWSFRIIKQLRTAQGCAGFSLDAALLTKTFWTLSAWRDQESMSAFVRSGAHAAMLADMAGRVSGFQAVDSTARQAELPLNWAGAHNRITA
jgi:hypothetical protein